MRKLLIVLLSVLALGVQSQPAKQRPKVGVVLSGGGAKGVAHIGVLRAVEEAGVPIDYIVGTSMGAVVGGLYAMGYTTAQLDTLVRTEDWELLVTDGAPLKELSPVQRERTGRCVLNIPLSRTAKPEMSGLVRGRNLGNLLTKLSMGYHDSISFDSLRVPFACVATNLANGEEVVFRSGVLAQAIRASMAFPGVLTPAVVDGKKLVDGGMVNNFPVDVARKMGADIVIGSTVQRMFDDSASIVGVQGVFQQIVSILSRNKLNENLIDCDLCLKINTDGVSTMDFNPVAIDTMLSRGYALAKEKENDAVLKRIWSEVSMKDSNITSRSDNQIPLDLFWVSRRYRNNVSEKPLLRATDGFDIRKIRFDSITASEERIIRKACNLKDDSYITQQQIEQAVRLMNTRFLYLNTNYSLTHADDQYDLIFHAHHRMASNVGIGARFDTEDLASLLLDAKLVFPTHVPSNLDITARLGLQYAVDLGFTVEPVLNRQVKFYYRFSHHDQDVNHEGNRSCNLVYNVQQGGLSFAYRQVSNFDLELGTHISRYSFSDVLFDHKLENVVHNPVSDTYFTAYSNVKFNSQDRTCYPTRGAKFFAECTFTTDNLTHLKRPHSFLTMMALWEMVCPIGKRFALLPRIGGRWISSADVPFIFSNAVGGWTQGKYIEHQLPFVGLSDYEHVRNTMFVADCKFRYNIFSRHYATFTGALIAEARDFRHMRNPSYIYGLGLQYGYLSKIGPIEASISYSGRCTKPVFYLSVGYDF